MIIFGAYGFIFSLKHYERNRLHTGIIKELLDEIDEELSSPRPSIRSLRSLGMERHRADYDKGSRIWITDVPVFRLWAGLHLLVAGFGLLLSLLIIISQ